MVGLLIGLVIGALLGSLIGAVILWAAAHWAEKMDIPYGEACGTVFFTYLFNLGIGLPVGFALGAGGASKEAIQTMQWALLPVGFLVQSATISGRHSVPFAKGMKIAFFMILVALAIVLVLTGIFFLIAFLGSTLGGRR